MQQFFWPPTSGAHGHSIFPTPQTIQQQVQQILSGANPYAGPTNVIGGDPGFIATQAGLQNQSAVEAARRAQAVQQLLVQYGMVPEFSGSPLFAGDVTDTVRQLAQQSTDAGLSALARLQHQYEISRRNILSSLRDRGMLDSGELPYSMGELDLANKQSRFDLANQILSQLSDIYGNFAANEANRRYQLSLALIDAMQRQAQNPWNLTGAPARHGYNSASAGLPDTGGYGISPGGATGSPPPGPNYIPPGIGNIPPGTPAIPVPPPPQPGSTGIGLQPSPGELARMAQYALLPVSQRPADVIALFDRYKNYRMRNPDWYKVYQ